MAYSHTLDLVQGDTNPQLTLTLRDANEAAPGKKLDPDNRGTWAKIDLTGGIVMLLVREVGTETVKEVLPGVLTDAPNGQVTFLITDTVFDQPGTYEGEIEFTDNVDRTQTVFDFLRFRIRPQF